MDLLFVKYDPVADGHTPDQIRAVLEALAQSTVQWLRISAHGRAATVLPLIISVLPQSRWKKLDIEDVALIDENVPALAAALRKSKVTDLRFDADRTGDAAYSMMADSLLPRSSVCTAAYSSHMEAVTKRRIMDARRRIAMRKNGFCLYESLLLERATTPVARFLNRDGDNAIMTGVLRFML